MRGMRETREIQSNNYQAGQCGQDVVGIFDRTHAGTKNR